MEAVLLVLAGGMLFSHSWDLLGLYTEGKTMGLINLALALGLVAVAWGVFSPITLPGQVNQAANPAVTPIQMYAILWGVYGVAVAAHGIWDFEERAIGFYALFVAFASLIYLIGIGSGAFSSTEVPTASALVLSASSLLLGGLSTIVFLHLGIPFRAFRPVAGWFLLVGSVAVALLGFSVMFGLIGS